MDFMISFKICGSALAAQRAKMDVITSNIANVDTTRTPEGGPYRKKTLILSTEAVESHFDSAIRDAVKSVKIAEVAEDPKAGKKVYDPAHPDSDPSGYVSMPNVNLMVEMAEMIAASRAYEACVTATDATKNMALKTLEIGR